MPLSQHPELKVHAKAIASARGYLAGQVEVTNQCYQQCKYCPSWRAAKSSEWSLSQMMDFCLSLMHAFPGFEHLTLTGGDPQCWRYLDAFLEWASSHRATMRLRICTSLCRKVSKSLLWREHVDEVWVSLDTYDPSIYRDLRGDISVTPDTVLHNMHCLGHPNLRIIVTAYAENISRIPDLIKRIENLACDGLLSPRAIVILPGASISGIENNRHFWECWMDGIRYISHRREIVPVEVPPLRQTVCNSYYSRGILQEVPCHVGHATFHAKSNGDLYPCNLVGGEMTPTLEQYKLGNIWRDDIVDIRRVLKNKALMYQHPDSVCRKLCQWKHMAMNIEAERATACRLSIP